MRTVEVKKISNDNIIWELLLELFPVLEISREAVKQISSVAVNWNAFFKQFDNQWRWEQFTLFDKIFNHLSILSAFLSFLTQKVAGWEMKESVVSDEIFSLGSFTTSWSTKEEKYVGFRENPVVLLLFLSYWWRNTWELPQPIFLIVKNWKNYRKKKGSHIWWPKI